MDKGKILSWGLTLVATPLFFFGSPMQSSMKVRASSSWQEALGDSVEKLEKMHPGALGVYVKRLRTGEEFSFRGNETWYFASGVKLPIAIELLKQVGEAKASLEDEVSLVDEDKMDSAGGTNQFPSGSKLSVRYLLEQMMIHSDNTASDLLIRYVGLENVNRTLQENVPANFHPITTLADVRRLSYSEFTPKAMELKNPDFLYLKSFPSSRERMAALSKILGERLERFAQPSLDDAFEAYYSKGYNSGTLRGYADLLEAVWNGRALPAEETRLLLDVMLRVETGQNRIVAGLPSGQAFAHKTGTQHRRICDFGISWNQNHPEDPLIITSCVKGFSQTEEAEAVLKNFALALTNSGVISL